ncbi:MAG: hypothetical protein K0S39_1030 [Paenibacillus sp.]|jgi:hypothetical protein|nr:hypothetical protein [Paenibacillus sp.]
MTKTFIEYRILPEHRSAYSEWMKQVRADYPELEVYEGADQPGLFVELWNGLSREEYEVLKEVRLRLTTESDKEQMSGRKFDNNDWSRLHNWVSGGAVKIHIWLFEKVR